MKPKTCKTCKTKFTPIRFGQTCCSLGCAIKYSAELKIKAEKKKQQQEKKVLREKVKTLSDYAKEAQTIFNRYIRLRDAEMPCISCGTTKTNIQYHAGHYRSVGAAPQLRFEELNVWKQCSACNNHKSGNSIEYRINLIKRIGVEKVEWLESQNKPKKYTKDELVEIKNKYTQKLKTLKENN